MRNDVKLGFAIGGVLLAVLIVYVLVVPGGSSQQKKIGQTTQPAQTLASNTGASNRHSATGADAGKVTLEPVTPAVPAPATPSAVPAVPPPSYTPPPTVAAATPATPKIDPFAPKADSSSPEPAAKASTSKNDDWNAILNQPPMLMTESPVATHTSTPAPSAVASATPSSSTPAATPSTPASSDNSFSALSQTPPISSEPAAPASQPTASSTGSRTHRIAQGETFASISTAAYGSSKYYPQIIKANPGVDPSHLKIGQTITLPDIATPAVRPTAPAVAATGAAGEAQRAADRVATGTQLVDTTKEYRVVSGDSLYKISLKLYGKSDRADKIFQLNKQAMHDDPHHLKVGQVLQLPEPPTQTTTASRT